MPTPSTLSQRAPSHKTSSGDQDAYQWLYKRYASMVYGLILRFTDSESEAGQILTNVFVELCAEPAFNVLAMTDRGIIQVTLKRTSDYLQHGLSREAFHEKAALLLRRNLTPV